MATATDESVLIENVGPNERLAIPYLPDGGVIVLRGANDMGKTEALTALKRIAGADEKLTRRDGFTGKGCVEGFGMKVTVSTNCRQSGECEVTSLEGRLDVSDLIEPREKSVEAADRKRIKALLSISGAKADVNSFASLVGTQKDLESVCQPESLTTDDLVDMAGRIKRDLERAARAAEDQAKNAQDSADAAKRAIEGIDMAAECDATVLDAEYRKAVQAHADLKAKRMAAEESKRKADEATGKLARLQKAHSGISLEEAEAEVTAKEAALRVASDTRIAAAQALLAAESAFDATKTALANAREVRDMANDFAQDSAAYAEIIAKSGAVDDPGQGVLEDAAKAVQSAREAVERGAVIRRAKEQLAAVEDFREAAKTHAKQADKLRNAAFGTDGVLSDAVRTSEVFVRDGRLVTRKNDRDVFYADRSPGYRATVAIDIALECVRATSSDGRAIVILDQRVWESLDVKNRKRIWKHAVERKVCVYTAEANRDESEPADVHVTEFAG
jgi:hypothetical protein